MPYPKAGEDKKGYIARFMSSSEAVSDYPDEKQRLAVAYSLWGEKKNSEGNFKDMYGREHPWPKAYQANFIEPGVVFYQDLGPCKKCDLAKSCGEGLCETEGETVLVRQDALAKMAKSFIGKPVIGKEHADVTPDTVANGEADGIVTEVWLDQKTGWWMCKYLVWDPQTQRDCESAAWSVSCAYNPTEVLSEGGSYHNLDYQQEILNGEYTHLAVVTNPRYEQARIQLVNSKGGNMSWKFWKKGDRKNAADLDPSKQMVNVDGQMIPLQNLMDAAKEAEKPKENAAPELSDDTVLQQADGSEKTLGQLKDSYRNKLKNAEEAAKCPACSGSGKKNAADPATAGAAKADAGHAEHTEGSALGREPLPDLRDPKNAPKNDQAEESAKKAEAAAKEKEALELQQATDAKAAEEKKNADDAAAKAAEEKKNADEAAAAEAKAKEEKRNAGRKSFESLRNAVNERLGEAVTPSIASMDERLARGRDKYGSAA